MRRTKNCVRPGSITTPLARSIQQHRVTLLLRSLNQIITYDAYHMAEVYLTQPTQIVAGSQAGSKWMSDDLYDRASSQDKRYHIVEGANHMDLYDGKAYVAEAISVLAPFFEETL